MRDDLPDFVRQPIDPIAMARRDLKKTLPRRFWKDVAVVACDGGFAIELDGKPVRTPAKAALVVPTQALADVLAAEWGAQTDLVDPDTMPVTRLINSALDGVASNMDATAAEIAKFAETDLVCYRAGEPDNLVAEQAAAWDPVLAFARTDLGARFVCSEGVVYVEQPDAARAAVREAVNEVAHGAAAPIRLAALSVMTSLTGSVLIALAVTRKMMTADTAWAAAHVDEDFQARHWGADSEASARREWRWRDMRVAADVYAKAA